MTHCWRALLAMSCLSLRLGLRPPTVGLTAHHLQQATRLHAAALSKTGETSSLDFADVSPEQWQYEYLDSGNQKRLERFGGHLVVRNCPSAMWLPGLPQSDWARAAIRHDGNSWSGLEKLAAVSSGSSWSSRLQGDSTGVCMELAASEQGQVGVFPEQQEQWRWIRETIQRASTSSADPLPLRVLNGFAYTGGSTLAALSSSSSSSSSGVGSSSVGSSSVGSSSSSSVGISSMNVTHLDASSAAVKWAQRNVATSNLQHTPCRFIVDDCVTFLRREVNRGKQYEGLIFDPPAFGRGGGGKIWKLEKDLPMLVELLSEVLSDKPLFVLLSCHDPAWGPSELASLLRSSPGFSKVINRGGYVEKGEMKLVSGRGGKPLPLGSFARVSWLKG